MIFVRKKVTFKNVIERWRKDYSYFSLYIVNTNSKKYVEVCQTNDATLRFYTNGNAFIERRAGYGFYNTGTYRTHIDITNDILKQTYIKLKTCVIFTTYEEAVLYQIKLRKRKGIPMKPWMKRLLMWPARTTTTWKSSEI